MANLEIIARLKNQMSGEATKIKEDMKGIAQATGEADIKAAAFAQRQRLLSSEMNKLAKEVAANKMSVDEANKKYEAFEKTLVKVSDVAPQVAASLDDIDGATKKGSMSYTELNQALELVTKGYNTVMTVAREVYEVVGEGAKIQAAQNTFANLAESIDTTAAALNSTLRQATSGMVSDLDLMAGANRFVAMGLATTQDEAGKLANIATQLGVAFRGDAAVGMEELALLLANQSIPRLDSFGVSAGKVRARIEELQEANKGMSRETAFMTAFMEQAEVTMGKIGDQAETTAAKMATAEANVKNFGDSFKATFSEGLLDNINLVAGGIFNTQENASSLGEKLGKIATDVSFLGFLRFVRDELKGMSADAQKASTSTQTAISGMGGVVAKGMNTIASYSGESKAAAQEMTAQIEAERKAMIASMTAVDDRRDAIIQHTQAVYANATALSAEATILYQSSDAYNELQDKMAQSNALLTEEEAAFRQSQAAAAAANATLREKVEAEDAAAEATRKHTEAVAAFAAQTGKAFMEAATAGDSLGYFNENLEELGTQMVAVTTGAAANSADFELLQDAYDKAAVKLDKYRLGIEGANLSEEERAEKIAQLSEQMGSYQAQMDALGGSVTTYSERTVTATINQAAVNQALVESIAAAGGSAEQIGAAALALGTMSAAQVEAAMKAAELEIRIAGVRQAYLDGTLTADQLSGAIAQQVEIVNGMTTQMNDASGAINLVGESERTTTQSTQAMIDKFGEVPDEVTTEFVITGDYAGATQAFLDKLNSIPREVDVNVNVHGGGANTNYGAGGYQPMSSGGRVEPFKSYLVGDAPGGGITPYTEMFIPDSPGFIVNNETLQRLMGSNQMGTPAAFGGGGQTSYSDSATIQITNIFYGQVDSASVGRLENSQRGIIEQALAERDKRLSAQSRMRS